VMRKRAKRVREVFQLFEIKTQDLERLRVDVKGKLPERPTPKKMACRVLLVVVEAA